MIAASYTSTSNVTSSQHYSQHHASISGTHREINKVVTRGITEQQGTIYSGTIDGNASPSLSRKNKPPHHRQTSIIKNQSVDR